jgi:hypothetical protein
MTTELKQLISTVKTFNKVPVQEVVDSYFADIVWSPLKDEWNRMNATERQMLIAKLNHERKSK